MLLFLMKVLYLHASSGHTRLLDMPSGVHTLPALAEMMQCAASQIQLSYLDPQHVLLQCVAYPHRANRAFYYKQLDYCRVGGDAAIVRVDGDDVSLHYELPPVDLSDSFDYTQEYEDCIQSTLFK